MANGVDKCWLEREVDGPYGWYHGWVAAGVEGEMTVMVVGRAARVVPGD